MSVLIAFAWPIALIILALILRSPLRTLLKLSDDAVSGSAQARPRESSPTQPIGEVPESAKVSGEVVPRQETMLEGFDQGNATALVREVFFWRTYFYMYASQFEALRLIGSRGKVKESDLRPYFLAAEKRGLVGFTFDLWLSYLTTNNLILRMATSDMAESEIELSPMGRDFLIWVQNNRLSSANLQY